MVVVAESLILLTGSFDLSLQSIYGLAPMIGAWLIVPKDGAGARHELESRARHPRRRGDRRRRRALQRLHGREAALQRLHLHARDADPARGPAAGDRQRPDDLHMPPSFIYLGSAYWFGFPVSAWATAAVFLVAGALPALSPRRPRDLRDRRQPRGGARGRDQGRPHPHRRLHRGRRARRGRRPDDRRPGRRR